MPHNHQSVCFCPVPACALVVKPLTWVLNIWCHYFHMLHQLSRKILESPYHLRHLLFGGISGVSSFASGWPTHDTSDITATWRPHNHSYSDISLSVKWLCIHLLNCNNNFGERHHQFVSLLASILKPWSNIAHLQRGLGSEGFNQKIWLLCHGAWQRKTKFWQMGETVR